MNEKKYFLWASVIFSFVTIVHGLRLLKSWDIVIGGWALPMWVSGLAVALAAYMAYSAYRLGNKRR